jgi:hypothetical protein
MFHLQSCGFYRLGSSGWRKALTAEMPFASERVRNEIKQWAAEMVVKEALSIGMNELLAEAAKPTNH